MSNRIPDAVTAKNLEGAFAGESMAFMKYGYFAKLARTMGDEDTAQAFEETAKQEIQHAFGHLDLCTQQFESCQNVRNGHCR